MQTSAPPHMMLAVETETQIAIFARSICDRIPVVKDMTRGTSRIYLALIRDTRLIKNE